MHGIQLSREFETPSSSIRRVDSFATHVAYVAGGIIARGFTLASRGGSAWPPRKYPGHKNPTSYAGYNIRVQLSAFTYLNFVLSLGFKATDENFKCDS